MKAFEKCTLKRSRAPPQIAKQKSISHDDLPDLCADSFSISSSSCAGSERSDHTTASSRQSSQLQSSRVTEDIQTKLRESLRIRKQQRNARQQWLEKKLHESPSVSHHRDPSPDDSQSPSMSFLPSTLIVKRKLVAVREQQVRNLLATERLMLQQVAVSPQ